MSAKFIKSIILSAIAFYFVIFSLSGCSEKTNPYLSDSFSTIKWPDSALAKLLPVPESTYGMIDMDRADWLEIHIGSTTQEQYESYVGSCKEKGFTEKYESGTDYENRPYYHAENGAGCRLSLEYHKEDEAVNYHPMKSTMTIRLQAPHQEESETAAEESAERTESSPTSISIADTGVVTPSEEESETAAEESAEKTESSPTSISIADTGVVTPSFKEMMDNYEVFFDSYIDFMKKYEENPGDLTMLSEYADYMNKFTDCMNKISDIDTTTLSVADLAYYTGVHTRILKKIAAAGITD